MISDVVQEAVLAHVARCCCSGRNATTASQDRLCVSARIVASLKDAELCLLREHVLRFVLFAGITLRLRHAF